MSNKINSKLSRNSLILIYEDTSKKHSLMKKEEMVYSISSMLGDYLPEPPVIKNTDNSLHRVLGIVLGNKSISKVDIGYSISKNPVQLSKIENEVTDKEMSEAEEKAERVKEILYGSSKDSVEKVSEEAKDILSTRVDKTIRSILRGAISSSRIANIRSTSLYDKNSSPVIMHNIKPNSEIQKNEINKLLRLGSKIELYSNFIRKMGQINEPGKFKGEDKIIDLSNTIKTVTSIKNSGYTSNNIKDTAVAYMNDLHKLCVDSKYPNIDRLEEEVKKQDELDFITQILITDSEGKYDKDKYDLVLNLDDTFDTIKEAYDNVSSDDRKKDFNHFMLSLIKIQTLTSSFGISEMFNNIDMSSSDLSSFSKINSIIEKYFEGGKSYDLSLTGEPEPVATEMDGTINEVSSNKNKKTTAKDFIKEIVNTIPKSITEFSENLLK